MSEWEDSCPNCDEKLDDYTAYDNSDSVPKTDDRTICFYCAQPLVFSDDVGHVRFPTESEMAEMLADPRIVGVMAAIVLHLVEE